MDYQHPPDGFNYSASQFHDLPPGDGPVYAPYDLNAPPLAGDLPPGSYYGDYGDGTDENDPKRRRIARACDMCRKKKIKCDGKLPKCSHCTNYKTECIFTHVEKKRNPPKGAKYIEALENRLGRMEQLIKLSGLITEEEAGRTDLGTIERKLAEKSKSQSNKTSSPKLSTDTPGSSTQRNESQGLSPQVTNASPRESVATPGSSIDKPEGVENISDMMCSLVTNGSGETRYIGSSSALSIFSQKGIEWVNEKTGDSSFQETIQTAVNEDEKETKWMFWKPEVFGDLFMRRVFKPLPPRDEAMSLFRDFFENFNCMFPLFHEPTFMHLAEKQYSNDPYESSSWWACINVALAIAYRLRVMSNVVPQDDDQKAWLYLKNALAVLAELLMRNTDLLSVQALLGCALFMSGTANPQPSFFLVSAAIRLSHSIGLHKKGSSFNLNPVEAEQRKRVFWVAYCVDKDTCLRSGRPSAQDDDDMNVELPSENPTDNVGNIPLADGGKINLFRLMCEFALIESKVYKKLYSVEAAKQSDGELLNTIGDLDKELEDWKDRIPIDFRPEHEIKASHTPLVLNIVVLHFSYYNCLATIHRMSVHHGYWTSRLSDYAISGINARPLNPRVFSSAALCVQAARASIHLIKYIPQGDFACVWLVIYFPVSALVTIFANILQNPQDARARADVKLMELVVNFLTNIVAEEGTGSFKRMLTVCSEFTRIARVVLDRAEKEGQKRKRKVLPEEQQSLSSGQRAMAQAQALAQNVARPITPPKRHAAGGSPLVNSTTMPNAAPSINQSPLRQGSVSQPFVAGDTAMPLPFSQPPFSEAFNPDGLETTFAPSSTPTTTMSPGAFGTSFQHPFVPQDLWQMPMTFEWDMWTDLNGQGYNNMEGNDAMMSNNGMQ